MISEEPNDHLHPLPVHSTSQYYANLAGVIWHRFIYFLVWAFVDYPLTHVQYFGRPIPRL